jgi:hypothetical protein
MGCLCRTSLRRHDEDQVSVKNDRNRINYSAPQNCDWTCIRRLFRLVEFRSARSIGP